MRLDDLKFESTSLDTRKFTIFTISKNRLQWEQLKGQLVDAGYHVSEIITNTKDFGLPQNRKRLYIVGEQLVFERNALETNLINLHCSSISLENLLPEVCVGTPLVLPKSHLWKLDEFSKSALQLKGLLNIRGHYEANSAGKLCTISPSVTTHDMCLYSFKYKRFLNGYDFCLLQGMPSHIAEFFVNHYSNWSILMLIGNAMSINVLCAILLSLETLTP